MNGFEAEDEPSKVWSLWLVAVIVSRLATLTVAATTPAATASRL